MKITKLILWDQIGIKYDLVKFIEKFTENCIFCDMGKLYSF